MTRWRWLWAAYSVSTVGTWFAFDAFPLIAILVLHAGPAAVWGRRGSGLQGLGLLPDRLPQRELQEGRQSRHQRSRAGGREVQAGCGETDGETKRSRAFGVRKIETVRRRRLTRRAVES